MDLMVSGNYLHLFAFNQCFAKADISGAFFFLPSSFCKCKSACSTKRKQNSSCGCPCKGKNLLHGNHCCGKIHSQHQILPEATTEIFCFLSKLVCGFSRNHCAHRISFFVQNYFFLKLSRRYSILIGCSQQRQRDRLRMAHENLPQMI